MKKRAGIGRYILAGALALTAGAIPLSLTSRADEEIHEYESGLPHFLQNVHQPKNEDSVEQEIEQIIEQAKIWDNYQYAFGKSTYVNGNIEERVNIHGKEVRIVFHNYDYQKNKESIQYVRWNNGTNDHERLSLNEFQKVKKYVTEQLVQASEEAYNAHKDLTATAIKAIEEDLKKNGALAPEESLADKLDKKVPGYETLTEAEAQGIPVLFITDFVPKTFHVTNLPENYLGVTYINSESVGQDLRSILLDYVVGKPNTLKHELDHNCKKLQGIPLIFEYDAEFHASMIEEETLDHFLRHPYLKDARKLVHILRGIDPKRIIDEVFSLPLAFGTELNKEKLRQYIPLIREFSQEIKDIYHKEFLPEFFAHQTFWAAVNDDLRDDNAAFKVFMYARFEPTLLGGPEPTKQWLEQNKYVIEQAAKKVLAELENEKKEQNKGTIVTLTPIEKQALDSFMQSLDIPPSRWLQAARIIKKLEESGAFRRIRP